MKTKCKKQTALQRSEAEQTEAAEILVEAEKN